ncbi:MAG: ribonuclease III [Chloroflexota bacterium]|nr:ribonuclease III [Chloroflexota bacterium]
MNRLGGASTALATRERPAALVPATPVTEDLVTEETRASTIAPELSFDPADDDRDERFAARLGLQFRNPSLLRVALTHRSVLHDWPAVGDGLAPAQSNERLEFLGDALLGAIAAEYLYDRYLDADEGTLTRRRVALVRAETLVRWAREIGMTDALYLGSGERITEGVRDRMLAGAFEALVGAIALDRGMRAARTFLRTFLARDAPLVVAGETDENPKGRLQELAQELYQRSPAYETLPTSGPDHARVFTAAVSIGERPLGSGSGPSKREAEQAAAREALTIVRREAAESAKPRRSIKRRKRGTA